MATWNLIQNKSFVKVVNSGALPPEINSPILMTCKDNQGNTIKKNIVEIDTALGEVNIMLPSIESLANDLDCEINFIILDGNNDVNFYAYSDGIITTTDMIGQNNQINFGGGAFTSGAVLTFKPAYDGYWTFVLTKN